MSLAQINIEGTASIGLNEIRCICGHCNNHDLSNAMIEFNFREQKVLYMCSQCKKMNEMYFGKQITPPLPRTRM